MGASCSSAQVANDTPGGGGGKGGNRAGSGNGRGRPRAAVAANLPLQCRRQRTHSSAVPVNLQNCGDGKLDPPGEQCDDGNTTNGDGCNALCQIEANWLCPTRGSLAWTRGSVGNGVLTSDETCDDNNTKDGDGCSGDCKTIEDGFECRVPGKPCTPICGDSKKKGSEACDDGNTTDGDGCSSTCQIEPGSTCPPGQAPVPRRFAETE
jgi:cysteine-rich repeat protein